jgi:hypothetical protein
MDHVDERDCVCPFNEPRKKYNEWPVRNRLTKDKLWDIASKGPVLMRKILVGAVKRYSEVCEEGSYFETCTFTYYSVSPRDCHSDPPEIQDSFSVRKGREGFFPSSCTLPIEDITYVPELVLRSVQEIDTPTRELVPHRLGFQCPIWVVYNQKQEGEQVDCCDGLGPGCQELWSRCVASSLMQQTIDQLVVIQDMRKIDKIVCFGLGHGLNEASFLQHAVAVNIQSHFEVLHGRKPDFKIHDNGYCTAWKDILNGLFGGIEFIDKFKALLEIDEHTFVICVSPSEAISHFVIGICHPRGPAALLCRRVVDDGRSIVQAVCGQHTATASGHDYPSPVLYQWRRKTARAMVAISR